MDVRSGAEILEQFGLAYFQELATFGALSDAAIETLLTQGEIHFLAKGEKVERFGEPAEDFQVVLTGKTAFYKRGDTCEVLTRYFCPGDQLGFDLMIGLIPHNGTDVAVEDTLWLTIDKALFSRMHAEHPADFGLLMINLSRELSREIAILEDVLVGAGEDTQVAG
ncbi:cyclic nucleotide-binding domain-containing protein [Halioglobus maricola]|uniref:Cyclic nucleotide-binding domain-containing protein n=1 Tax=Halioglobus maricola TaxID=2601894 RepID=A0A5P9NIU5_9GAMM|nr:cyclic nucleotide-binding domain-containing protein [Halioglobus maricola]QFU75489.1 cyclic nucleotide-binding domain-containing protein [Halioglobus maricola]